MTKGQKLYNAKQKLEAVLRYAEIALREVDELLELPEFFDESDEEEFPEHPDKANLL